MGAATRRRAAQNRGTEQQGSTRKRHKIRDYKPIINKDKKQGGAVQPEDRWARRVRGFEQARTSGQKKKWERSRGL